MKTYIYKFSACKQLVPAIQPMPGQAVRKTGIGKTEATNEAAALIIATAEAHKKFPECDGWLGHKVEVAEIPADATIEIVTR